MKILKFFTLNMDLKYDNEVYQRGGEKKEKKEKIIIYTYI